MGTAPAVSNLGRSQSGDTPAGQRKPTVAVGCDHGGFQTKQKIVQYFTEHDYSVIDMGSSSAEPADYPIFGFRAARAVGRAQADLGVLLCRSGNGMAMAANRVPGVRAAIAGSVKLAELARRHNDANILVMGDDFMEDDAIAVLEAFLTAMPEGERHVRRVDIIKDFDRTVRSTLATHQLIVQGQSPWLDDISDTLIASGSLLNLIEEKGIRGVTSNPSIFEKAIGGGQGRYRGELAEMKRGGVSADEAYERLTTQDIKSAARLLRPIYDRTGGDDGFVSLEVLPAYAYQEEKTIEEAVRLFETLAEPNVMIKVPGTVEGIRAFRRLTAAGVNINVTLIFSRRFYNDIARAYIAGLEDRRKAGGDITRVRSVASVFVSRIDTAVDQALDALKKSETDPARLERISALVTRIAIANTRLIYDDFKSIFYGPEFASLAAAGGAVQRPLWGSTSTKNPDLPDTLYVEELIGPDTVNTIPGKTLEAMLDHGRVRGCTLEEDLDRARTDLETLGSLGIDIEHVCLDLQKAGVQSFADAFDKLFDTIQQALA